MKHPLLALLLVLLFVPVSSAAQAPTKCRVGLDVDVLWEGYWLPSTVLTVDAGSCLVHYDGYGDEDNEWVGLDRIRFLDKQVELDPGTVIEVFWGEDGEWYPATIIESRGARYHIHYTGWTSQWDEWIGPDRLRFPKRGSPKPPLWGV